jgi:TonB family protein
MSDKIILMVLITFFGLAFTARGQELQNSASAVPLKIITQPTTNYTDEARKNKVEGWVRLRVTFLANGQIGEVIYIKESSKKKKLTKYGLVQQAIEAAKIIKFEPARKDGQPITVTKTVEYYFTIY